MTASAVERIGKAVALDVEAIAKAISRSQCVCLCFLMDTTGSMASHISGVKKQVQEIVKNVRDSGCRVNSLAFIGYKDWCDGHDHFEVCLHCIFLTHCSSFFFLSFYFLFYLPCSYSTNMLPDRFGSHNTRRDF